MVIEIVVIKRRATLLYTLIINTIQSFVGVHNNNNKMVCCKIKYNYYNTIYKIFNNLYCTLSMFRMLIIINIY